MTRPVYRTWYNDGDGTEHFLRIKPTGELDEIIIHEPDLAGGLKIYMVHFGPLNPINQETFIKHKEVLSKADWNTALKKAKNFIK